ncbi:MAG: Gfo/Idh/MocA family oxidoreductase, partial [Fidelibacterota bacterium]
MSSDTRSKVGVVGCGYWGKNLVRNFHQLGALRVICDTNHELLDAIRRSYAGVGFTTECDDLLNDGEVDGVVIATSPAQHYAMVKAALIRG